MDLVNQYFRGLIFTQVDEKKDGNLVYTVYGAGINGSLGDGSERYVLLFVPSHLAIRRQSKIEDLHWVNIQTRTIKEGYRLKHQSFAPPRDINDPTFHAIERTNSFTKYKSNDAKELEILLIHDPKKKSMYQYQLNISLFTALETFKSVTNYSSSSESSEVELI